MKSLALCLLIGSLFIGVQQLQAADTYATDRASIRALRAENNRALAAHDLEGTMRIVAPDYVMVGGNSGIERSPAENRKGWAEEFHTPGHDRYVRTPEEIEVGSRKGVLRAGEVGRWEGIDHKPTGISRPYGKYFVHWSKITGHWLVVSETYVTLGCRGSGCQSASKRDPRSAPNRDPLGGGAIR